MPLNHHSLPKGYAKALGAVIRKRRQAVDMNLVKLAAATGYKEPTLSTIENGLTTPALATLCAIAKALGCTASDILRECEKR